MRAAKSVQFPWLPATALSLVAIACQSGDATSGNVIRERFGDTLHVHNRAPVHADTATLREVARIGVVQGPEQQMLNDVSAFVGLPDGRMAVADDAGLRTFSSDGQFIELLARRGEGPGEIGYITGMAVTPDGSLLAADLGNRRINIYDASGEIDQWPLPPGMPGNGRNSIVATPDGAVYVAYNPPLPAQGTTVYPRPIFLRLGPSGVPIDTIYANERFIEQCPTLSSNIWRAGFYEDLREPYFPKVKWALAPSGVLAVGCPAGYRVDLVQVDGTILRISRDAEPVIASSEERQTFVDVHTFVRKQQGFFENWSWQGPEPPDRRPAYDRMLFSQDGSLWIWPAQPSTREEVSEQFVSQGAPRYSYEISNTGAFDVFIASGEYVGAVRLPDDVPYYPFPGRGDPFIRADTLWAMRFDSLDVPYLTKYVIEWPEADNASGG